MAGGGGHRAPGRPLLAAALAAVGAAPPPPPARQTRPVRIVSINPCVDAILVRVADPAEIAGISHYSQQAAATSIPLALARRFPATSGTAEEVVALRPDVVLAGGHVDPATAAALARMRIRLVTYPVASSVAESEAQVRDVAAVASHPARGAALAGAIDRAARPAGGARVSALILMGGGLVPGAGTLADDLLARAGFRNVSAALGLKRWDVLPLEYLVARPPRVLFSNAAAAGARDRVAGHPALARLRARTTLAAFPARLLNCGGPTIIPAMARLRQVREGLRP